METLCFEVAPFKSGYHTLQGRPAYAKFMVLLCYAYLQLKMLGPNGVITISSNASNALEAKVATLEHAEAALVSAELKEIKRMVDSTTTSLPRKPKPGPAFQN